MLNIYYANESIDKEKFIFSNIKANQGRTLLIVPDQFSAQTERNAFFYLGKKATMDLRVFHFERLGHKAIEELGTPVPALIDKYGRHMLLTNIIRREEKAGNLSTYNRMSEKNTFVTMMNTLISEMKRNEVTPELLEEVTDKLDDNSYLKRKLHDIGQIFKAYEQDIDGKYLDSEDYITFYGDAIADAPMVEGANVWLYGFDTFTPKNMLVIDRLIRAANSVNIVMNYETGTPDANDAAFLAEDERDSLFELTGFVISKLEELGKNAGVDVTRTAIDGEPRVTLWAKENGGADNITLVGASNTYEEADRAASYILDLVRNEGYRYGDMAVICNDMPGLGAILKRTLDKWGIPAFVDNKRTVLHHPAVGFVLALIDIVAAGFKTESVMALLKSGLMEYDDGTCDLLENYAFVFKLRGSNWKNPFVKKSGKMTDEDLVILNELRELLVQTAEGAKEAMGQRNKASEKLRGLYNFLVEEFKITDRIQQLMDEQEAAGLSEAANETAQSWNTICSIFGQIVSIVGDNKISNIELKKLLADGLEEAQIGLVPVHSDSVIIGTLQRTRISRNKVLLVVGANEGVIPMAGGEEGILSENEKELLDGMKVSIGKTDSVMHKEESLAIYRNLTAPEDKLYMSYSKANSKGDDTKPSYIFEKLKAYVGEQIGSDQVKILGDSGDDGDVMNLVTTPEGTLSRVAGAMRKYRDDGSIDEDWYNVINWYVDHEYGGFGKMRRGMGFTNASEKLGSAFAQDLYMGNSSNIKVSASRLETYSGCPFAHFIDHGLKAEELQQYELGSRETGDIYHECLMRLSQKLTPTDGSAINSENSPWMTVDESGCGNMVQEIITKDMLGYHDGLIDASQQERYRVQRIINICSKVAMSMIRQVQKGQIDSMAFEEKFDLGKKLNPITVKVGDKEIILRGTIDRMDILNTADGGHAIRIVDYKTGIADIKKEYYEAGYKLQLMVYLNAALANNADMSPAGVFHFKIDEMEDDNDDGKASKKPLDERLDLNYRLQGFVLNEEDVIRAMDADFESESNVIPVKSGKDNKIKSAAKGKLFSREEFTELCDKVNEQVERICGEIAEGNIDIAPVKTSSGSACTFCQYRSICVFDTSFKDCRYKKI